MGTRGVREDGTAKRDVARGALWILLEVGSAEGINLVSFVVLSRILSPADYGVAAIAGVVAALLQLPLTRGFADAVVVQADMDEATLSTAFWANMALAAALFAAVQVGADGIAWCFGHPLVAPMLRWFSLCFFTMAVTSIPLASLRRGLRFETYAIRAAIGAGVGGALGIVMAATGFGIWSFVGAQVGQGIGSAVTVFSVGGWRLRMRFSMEALRRLTPFGAHSASGAILDFLTTKVDVAAVGLTLDATSLGYYYLLKRLLQVATSATIYPAFSIMMPALRGLAGEAERFNRAYISLVSVAQASWALIAVGLLAATPDLVPAVFGSRWTGAVPLLQTASLSGFAFALVSCTSQALGASGQARAYVPLGIAQVGATAVLVGVVAQFGVEATGAALALSPLALLPLNLRALRRHVGLEPSRLLRPCIRIAAAGAVAAGAALLARTALVRALPGLPTLAFAAADGVLCVLAYGGALCLLAPSTFRELADLARAVLPDRKAPRLQQAKGS